jgi:hypothetical protein
MRGSAPRNAKDSLPPGGQVLNMRGQRDPGRLANNKSLALCDDAAERQMAPKEFPLDRGVGAPMKPSERPPAAPRPAMALKPP